MKVKKTLLIVLLSLLSIPFLNHPASATDNTKSFLSTSFADLTKLQADPAKYDASKYAALGINSYLPSCTPDQNDDIQCVAPTGDQITWIGDSYSVGAESIIKKTFPGVDLGEDASEPYIHGSKFVNSGSPSSAGGSSGISILKSIVDAGKLRPYLVFALGTNGPSNKSEFEQVIDLAGSDTNIVFVTARTEDNIDYSSANNALKELADENQNVYLADWAGSDKYSKDFFINDSIHPYSNGGYDVWVDIIKEALPASCGGGLLPGDENWERIWNYLIESNISGLSDNPAALAGVVANAHYESGYEPLNYADWDGHPSYGLFMNTEEWARGGELRDKVNSATGGNYWGNTDSPQDIEDEAIRATIDFVKDLSGFTAFLSELNTVDNTPEGYVDLFRDTYEICNMSYDSCNNRHPEARRIYDEAMSKGVSSSVSQSSISSSSSPSKSSSSSNKSSSTGGNPIVDIDGHKYTFPLQGAAKSNYLNPGGEDYSVLSSLPCNGACHHDYYAVDIGLRKKKVDGSEYTSADFPGSDFDDLYYYSTGVKVLAPVSGKITTYDYYRNRFVPSDYHEKCSSVTFQGDDGNKYWLGHMSYSPEIASRVGEHIDVGEVIGEIGPPQCAQSTQAHLHLQIGDGDPQINDIINKLWDSLPETAGSCGPSDAVKKLQETVKKLASDEAYNDGSGFMSMTNEYIEALGRSPYKGGSGGIDCGAFVTILMHESGWDPDYNSNNGNTQGQYDYLMASDKWELLNPNHEDIPESDLLPGDVAILPNYHTFAYVGQIEGRANSIASASLGARAPSAGAPYETPGDGSYWWFRNKDASSGSGTSCKEEENICEVKEEEDCSPYDESDFPNYYQADPKWQNQGTDYDSMGGGFTNNGCSATSYAEIISALTGDSSVTPVSIAQESGGGSILMANASQGHIDIAKNHGLEYEVFRVSQNDKEATKQAFDKYLDQNWMISTSGGLNRAGNDLGSIAWSSSHAISVLLKRGDEYLITHANGYKGPGKNQWYTWDELWDMGITGDGDGYNAIAVRNPEKASSSCGSIGEGGLTVEQAEKFMENYRNNKNGWTTDTGELTCNTISDNCVFFSGFYVKHFTDMIWGSGNGSEVVNGLGGSVTKDSNPSPWAVFSHNGSNHTGVILGYHDGKWIVGQAGWCHSSGEVVVSEDINAATWNYGGTLTFGHPDNVDTSKILEYIK